MVGAPVIDIIGWLITLLNWHGMLASYENGDRSNDEFDEDKLQSGRGNLCAFLANAHLSRFEIYLSHLWSFIHCACMAPFVSLSHDSYKPHCSQILQDRFAHWVNIESSALDELTLCFMQEMPKVSEALDRYRLVLPQLHLRPQAALPLCLWPQAALPLCLWPQAALPPRLCPQAALPSHLWPQAVQRLLLWPQAAPPPRLWPLAAQHLHLWPRAAQHLHLQPHTAPPLHLCSRAAQRLHMQPPHKQQAVLHLLPYRPAALHPLQQPAPFLFQQALAAPHSILRHLATKFPLHQALAVSQLCLHLQAAPPSQPQQHTVQHRLQRQLQWVLHPLVHLNLSTTWACTVCSDLRFPKTSVHEVYFLRQGTLTVTSNPLRLSLTSQHARVFKQDVQMYRCWLW